MILDGSRKSFDETLSTLECFSKFSGLKINNNKTKIVWIGSKFFSKDVYHHVRWKFDWDCTSFKLLGIDFNINLEEMVDYNFGKYIPKIKSTLLQWSRRNITPLGKITVLKTLIIPILNHLFIALPTPKKYIALLNSMFFTFIWGNKVDKIKRNIITNEYEKGGLKMIHLSNFIDALK